ncbi:sialate O-acetylesterase [Hymenobacter taeanensis]|uniref:Sialate O-acetylesterase n=1 Tax=Hymenobacter taeanensis TaxID=2735321 RepID=A0A6M6BJI5_9BACT|nr:MULTISPECIES: sialate O-acetylesterase [Hymenobacter]QJX48220.1 sialate O-acetylesterase [Hymenobacter taeanensis]UOQ82303.1 sialate O-acetylesterase [Hymenobacter sp. 5414T-23]
MIYKALVFLLLLTALAPQVQAQNLQPVVRKLQAPPARKEKFQLYLLVGQSNMAGRGQVEAQDTATNPRVLRLNKAGQWELAQDPLHFDKPTAGVGPGLTFGRDMAALDPSVVVGLIPCAVGGSGIDVWQPGAYFPDTQVKPYDEALDRARLAMQQGRLAGIIWHQGETDCTPEKSAAYQQKLRDMIARFRQDLQAPTVPFVAGQLPAFQFTTPGPKGKPQPSPDLTRINRALVQLKHDVGHYEYISTEGTHDRGDQLHFDAAAARLLGHRYAQAMRKLQQSGRSRSH